LVEQRIPNPQVVGSSPSAPARLVSNEEIEEKMATEEDMKTKEGFEPPHPSEDEVERANELIAPKDGVIAVVHDSEDETDDGGLAPAQLGAKRYVYAGYFAAAICIAFLGSKFVELVWTRLQMWKPQYVGEPRAEYIMPASAALGAAVAWYYWKQQRTRELAEEVASELSKVTWPTKDEVMSSTAVVIVTTIFSTIFFALMDRFWSFLTNLVYGT
jgi:preprotein translocase subunit SecE